MAGYDFPNVSFDWLGRLPAVAEEASQRASLKQTLADLGSDTSPGGLEKGAIQLFRSGNFDAGLKLYQAAQQRRAVDQRGIEAGMYLKWLQGGGLNRTGGPPPPDVVPSATSFGAGGGSAAPVVPAAPSVPSFLGGAGVVPAGPGAAFPPPPGPRSEAPTPPDRTRIGQEVRPSPSEEMLAAAEGPAPGQLPPAQALAPGPQLAGPPPAPGPAPPQGQIPTGEPPLPPGMPAPAAPPAAAPPGAPAPSFVTLPPKPGIQNERQRLEYEMANAPPGRFGAGVRQTIASRYKALLEQEKYSKEDKQYLTDQADRFNEGLPIVSRSVHDSLKAESPKVHEEMLKVYDQFRTRGDAAQGLKDKLEVMKKISQQPNFINGKFGEPIVRTFANSVEGLYDLATSFGIDPGFSKRDIPGMNSAALSEAYLSLANQSVLSFLGGSLARTISDSDRKFVTDIVANLPMTSKGIDAILEVMGAFADRADGAWKEARKYRAKKENSVVRATAPDMEQIVENYANERPLLADKNGNLTPLGKKIEALSAPQPGIMDIVKRAKDYIMPPEPAPTPAPQAPSGRRSIDSFFGGGP